MTEEQALAFYERGPEVTVYELMRLSQENTELKTHVLVLETCLRKNEILPTTPSRAIPPYKKENVNPKKGKGRKKPGRKKGHKGAGRKRPKKVNAEAHHHLSQCPCCGGKDITPLKNYRMRFIEGIKRLQTWAGRHFIHRYYCAACKKIVEPTLIEALPKGQISLYTFALGAWLHYHVGMSLSNVVRQFKLAGLKITEGALINNWRRMSALIEPLYDQIIEEVKNAAVLSADETGWRISGVTYWLWYFGTKEWSYYVVDKRRSSKVVQKVLGDILKGILICDFWGAYNALNAAAKQRCMYHLLTELSKVDKRNGSQAWRAFRKKLCRLIRDAVKLAAAHESLDKAQYQRRQERIKQRLIELMEGPTSDKDAQRLIKRLRRHQHELWVFLDHPETVSPYNNHAEQEMRKPVQTRLISHGNRSEMGAKVHAIFMSFFRSLERQGIEPVDGVLKLVETALTGRKLDLKALFSAIQKGEDLSPTGQVSLFNSLEDKAVATDDSDEELSQSLNQEPHVTDGSSSCQPLEEVQAPNDSKSVNAVMTPHFSSSPKNQGCLKKTSRNALDKQSPRKSVKQPSRKIMKCVATAGLLLLWIILFGNLRVPSAFEHRSCADLQLCSFQSLNGRRLPKLPKPCSSASSARVEATKTIPRMLSFVHWGPDPPPV